MATLGILEHGRIAAVVGDDVGREFDISDGLVDFACGVPQRHPGGQVERQRDGLQLTLVVHCSGAYRALHGGKARQWHQRAAALAAQAQACDGIGGLAVGVIRFQNDLVTVGGGVDGGDLPITEGRIKRAAHILHRHAQHRRAVGVDFKAGLQALVLAVTGHIAKGRVGAQHVLYFGGPLVEGLGAHALQGVLVACLALAATELQVLHRAQKHGHAGHRTSSLAQALHHPRHGLALSLGLEHDEHAAIVAGGIAASDEGGQILHGRVLAQNLCHLVLQLQHADV